MLETFTNFFVGSIILSLAVIAILLALAGLIKVLIEIPSWIYNKTKSDTAATLTAVTLLITGISTIVATFITIMIEVKR